MDQDFLPCNAVSVRISGSVHVVYMIFYGCDSKLLAMVVAGGEKILAACLIDTVIDY